ncbi:four helix bundle protein [Geobacter metallireducens]|uniref:four helix bundle protein n=1 Tax=Geobacter metallireducens TaxID=28232 RepID=UPI001930AEAD|nr:four helix bundle protein [Geobacter metallireducens]
MLVWEKSVELAATVYRVTDGFPRHEQFGISSQMRRSAVSVPSNIAEGAARKGGHLATSLFLMLPPTPFAPFPPHAPDGWIGAPREFRARN